MLLLNYLKVDIMDKKVIGIGAIVAIIIIAIIAVVAMGGMGGSGGILGNATNATAAEVVTNKTYDFEYCTLELPNTTNVVNLSNNEDGFEAMLYIIADNATNSSFTMAVATGDNMISSADEYVGNMNSQGNDVEKVEDYGKWVIVKNNDNSSYKYMAVNIEGGHGFLISHDDMGTLKQIVDTYKFKS